MEDYRLYIQRCFDLARLAAGKVSPNPKVGAVITFEGSIIGEGFHEFLGGSHAELNAIKSVRNKTLLSKASLFISLEPCNNFGRTPPCVDTILKYKIPKVFISVIDPHPLTMGKSVEKLKAASVSVELNILPSKGIIVSQGFFSSIQKGRPYVILKFAQSINKKMGIKNKNYWISNEYTKRLTHKWRSEVNAIMVGSKTLEIDNPKLNNRMYFGRSPVKLLLKRDGSLPANAAALLTSNRNIIICELMAKMKKKPNIIYWELPFDKNLISNILKNLKKEGLNSLLVEGGASLINSFIAQNLWDEARVFTGDKPIHHPNSIPAPDPEGILTTSTKIGNNLLEVIENKKEAILL